MLGGPAPRRALPAFPLSLVARASAPLTLTCAHTTLNSAYLECNYGVAFPIDFDSLWGSKVDIEWVEKTKSAEGRVSLSRAKKYGRLLQELGSSEAAAAAAMKVE